MNGSLPFYSRKRKDNPEARLQKAVLQHIKLGAPDGVFAIHPANEGRRSVVTGANLKALGMVPGAADLIIFKDGRAFALELKSKDGRLSDTQREFAAMCEGAGIPWAVAHGIDDALSTLRSWGILRSKAA